MDNGASGLILDTSAVSALGKQDPAITATLAGASRLDLPVPGIGEYRYGIAQSNRSAAHQEWFESFIGDCIVLDLTNETTHHYASISLELRKIGRPIPANDIWIASLCRQHNLPLLSRDRHFDVVLRLKRLSW